MDRSDSDRRRGRRGERPSLPSFDDGGPPGHRHARLQRILFEEISTLLRDEVRDRALAEVRVVRTELSLDYANARIHYLGDPAARVEMAKAFERVTPFLRARLAESLDLKRVPQLRFLREEAVAGEGDPWSR